MEKTTIIFLSVVAVCLLIVFVLAVVVKYQCKKYKNLKEQYEEIESDNEKLSKEKTQLKEDLEIERKKKMELAKKLADISCLPVDDVLHQLQNNRD